MTPGTPAAERWSPGRPSGNREVRPILPQRPVTFPPPRVFAVVRTPLVIAPTPSSPAPASVELSPVELRLKQILADVDFPAISNEALEALKQVPDDETSIQRLANIVLREYALTVKVLRTANSAHYRRSDKHIRSAAHAMLLLGAGTVRNLAGSLLLFEHYRKRSPGLKELMLLSLLTANHAREVAMLRNLPDPEEANLCGMFRNLGEVLVAAYFPRDYALILQHMEQRGSGQAAAAFDVLGFPFEDLGETMARNWGMPDRVVAGIRSAGPQASDETLVITAFSHELTTAVYRRELDPTRDGVADVLARYARRLKLGRDEVAGVLQAALRETKATFACAHVTLDGLTLRKQQHAALAALGAHDGTTWDDDTSADGGGEHGAGGPTAGGQAQAASAVDPMVQLRLELRGEVERMAMPGSGEDLSRVILMALEAAFRGGPFHRVVLCMMTTDHRQLKARYGLGAGVEAVLDKFTCELDSRTSPIALAVVRRMGVCLPLERDFSPSEWRFAQTFAATSYVVVPLVVAGKAIGCLYCDRAQPNAVPDAGTVAYVRAVCEGVQRGITARNADAHGHTLHTAEFKRDAVLRLFAGERIDQVATSLAVEAETLEVWRREFLEGAMTRLGQ